MKRIIAFIFCISAFSAFSQTDEQSPKVKQFEIGVDFLDLAATRSVDISFEYVKNPDIGFGLTVRGCFDDEFYERVSVTPFFRYYFFNKQDYGSKGFYAESFLKLFSTNDSRRLYDSYDGTYSDPSFDAAFGVGIGTKFVNKNGFTLDLNVGGGRAFSSSDFVGRIGLVFGYRF